MARYTCDSCGDEFNRKADIVDHVQDHVDEYQFDLDGAEIQLEELVGKKVSE